MEDESVLIGNDLSMNIVPSHMSEEQRDRASRAAKPSPRIFPNADVASSPSTTPHLRTLGLDDWGSQVQHSLKTGKLWFPRRESFDKSSGDPESELAREKVRLRQCRLGEQTKAIADPVEPPPNVDLSLRGVEGNRKVNEHAPSNSVSTPPLFPPPPPPAEAVPHFLRLPQYPPPPPPPRSGATIPAPVDVLFHPQDAYLTPTSFLSAQYSSDSVSDLSSQVVRITSFRRNVYVVRLQAHLADFEEYKWLFQHGSSGLWYEKPSRATLRSLKHLDANRWGSEELVPLFNARPVSLETPRVWASSALTTPTDDDIYECVDKHPVDDDDSGICSRCTEERSEALEDTDLVYCLVLTTCQASEPFIQTAHFNGRQIYKLVKCGSREAAAAEAFEAAGNHGWNVAFSCVMRLGADFEDASPRVKITRADYLWMLAQDPLEENHGVTNIKVFF